MISPPFGINLFVIIHGIRGRGTLSDVEKGSAPSVISLPLMIILICIFPEIVMVLPAHLRLSCGLLLLPILLQNGERAGARAPLAPALVAASL